MALLLATLNAAPAKTINAQFLTFAKRFLAENPLAGSFLEDLSVERLRTGLYDAKARSF